LDLVVNFAELYIVVNLSKVVLIVFEGSRTKRGIKYGTIVIIKCEQNRNSLTKESDEEWEWEVMTMEARLQNFFIHFLPICSA